MPRPQTITWVVVANAEHARVLEERHPGAPLQELADWDRRPGEEDRRRARHEARVQEQRFGRPTVNPKDFAFETEEKFISLFADELRRAAVPGRYERLLLIAPAKTLGILRKELGDVGARRIERTLTCDCVQEDVEALEDRVRKLREKARSGGGELSPPH
jgi:protein required for attachment to host cells